MLTAAGIVYVLRDHIGYAFTSNSDIINRLKPMAPYLAGFQAAYGVYGSAQGVLRATSHQLDILGYVYACVCVFVCLFCLLILLYVSCDVV